MSFRLTSYMTHFTKPARTYPSAQIASRVQSKRALERRLVLPLESGNWMRAIEVLYARYAIEGRNSRHVEQILECMVKEVYPHNAAGLVPVVDAVRDRMYEGELPSSDPLWVTLIRSYCTLQAPREALEALEQWLTQLSRRQKQSRHSTDPGGRGSRSATDRVVVNDFYAKSVCNAIFPLLVRHGMTAELERVASILSPTVLRSDASLQRWVQEASARSGNWEAALTCLLSTSAVHHTAAPRAPLGDTANVLNGLCISGQWERALSWLSHQLPPNLHVDEALECQRQVLKSVVSNATGQWEVAAHFVHRFAIRKKEELAADAGGMDARETTCTMDRVMLRMLLQCLDSEVSRQLRMNIDDKGNHHQMVAAPHGTTSTLRSCDASTMLVQWLDTLSSGRFDNFRVDNVNGAVFLRALLLEGLWERALHFVGATPLLKGMARGQKEGKSGDDISGGKQGRAVETQSEKQIVGMLYALHGRYGKEAQRFTLRKYPFAFPKEVFRPDGAAAQLLNEQHRAHAPSLSGGGALLASELFERSGKSSTAALTERADVVLKNHLVEMHHHNRSGGLAFRGDDPNKDPTPSPVGIHDKANGWNFVGRAGLPVYFGGGTKFAHMLSSHPKHMPSLRNSMRGWNLQQNSALGHRSNVRKWNGRSSV